MPLLLPDAPATDYICVSISIPNTRQDIRNFMGQLAELSRWFNYERTNDNLGSQVAKTWLKTTLETRIGSCMIVRQNPTEPCTLQLSTDDGQTWEDWADITSCVNADYIQSLIENNESLADVIRRASSSEYYDVEQSEDSEIANEDALSGQAKIDCDKDKLFGATTQIVDLLNLVSSDVLELFETAFATPSRIGDVIEAIPGVGLLPFDDALQFLEKMSQQVKSAYDAAYDTQLRDDFRCELLCIAEENCQLTIGQMRDYFKDKITVDVSSAQSFLSLVEDILVNNWLGLQSVYLMNWFILDAIIYGTEILGIDNTRLTTQMSIFWNDPDPDWGLLCDGCGWTKQYYGGAGDVAPDGWVYAFGQYDAQNDRATDTFNNSTSFVVRIEYTFTIATILTGVEYGYTLNYPSPDPSRSMRIIYTPNGGSDVDLAFIRQYSPQNDADYVQSWDGNLAVNVGDKLTIQIAVPNATPTNFCTLNNITITGIDDDPF